VVGTPEVLVASCVFCLAYTAALISLVLLFFPFAAG
jgi:hypothetical protein